MTTGSETRCQLPGGPSQRSLKVAAALFLAAFSSVYFFLPLPAQERVVVPGPKPAPEALAEFSDRLEAIADRVLPAVAAIEVDGRPQRSKESGSGVIVKLDGRPDYFVLTNHHVVRNAELQDIAIVLKDGKILRPTELLFDEVTDVAFMKVKGAKGLPTAPLGNSDNARVGRLVLVMGNPFGHGWSVSHGIISATERGTVNLYNQTRIKEFLQTDAAINPGSSGGPLVDMRGQVIGITTAISSHTRSSAGVGFCLPINMFKSTMIDLLDRGVVQRGYLGLQLADDLEPKEALRLGRTDVNGALVERVTPGSPADLAGLRPADIILQMDKTAIRDESQFTRLVRGTPPGQVIRLQVWRNESTTTIEAKVGDWNKAL